MEYKILRNKALIIRVVANLDVLPLILHVDILVVILFLCLFFYCPNESYLGLELDDRFNIKIVGVQEIGSRRVRFVCYKVLLTEP